MDSLFALGLVGPLLLLCCGFVAVGLSFSCAMVVARRRSSREQTKDMLHQKIGWAAVLLGSAALLPIVAGVVSHFGAFGAALDLLCLGCFLLWPISVIFTFLGKGVGRNLLFVAHGLIIVWAGAILLVIWIHGV